MLADPEFQAAQKALKDKGQRQLTKEERKQRQRALDDLGVVPFDELLANHQSKIKRRPTDIFQMNIGLYCNQVSDIYLSNYNEETPIFIVFLCSSSGLLTLSCGELTKALRNDVT